MLSPASLLDRMSYYTYFIVPLFPLSCVRIRYVSHVIYCSECVSQYTSVVCDRLVSNGISNALRSHKAVQQASTYTLFMCLGRTEKDPSTSATQRTFQSLPSTRRARDSVSSLYWWMRVCENPASTFRVRKNVFGAQRSTSLVEAFAAIGCKSTNTHGISVVIHF